MVRGGGKKVESGKRGEGLIRVGRRVKKGKG
jgi:hypothetical protein